MFRIFMFFKIQNAARWKVFVIQPMCLLLTEFCLTVFTVLFPASRKKLLKQVTPTSSIILLEPMETQLTRFLSSFPDLSELFSPPMVGFTTVNIIVRSWDHSQRSHTGNFLSLLFRVNSCRRFLTLHSMVWEWFHSSAVLRVSACQRATETLSTCWSAPAEVSVVEAWVTPTLLHQYEGQQLSIRREVRS